MYVILISFLFFPQLNKNFIIHKELLLAVPLHGTERANICNSLVSVANAFGGFEKCTNAVT